MFGESAIHGISAIQQVLSSTALFDNRSFVLESWLVRSDTGGKECNIGLARNIFPVDARHGNSNFRSALTRTAVPAVEKIDV